MKGHPELALILKTLPINRSNSNTLNIDPNINWAFFYKLVCRHRVWHQVLESIDADTPITQTLRAHCQHDKQRILITAGETIRVSKQLSAHHILHAFVKGTLLNVYLYGELGTRPCRDIDVWIDVNDYKAASKILLSLGYQKKLPHYELTGFKERYYLKHRHDIAFYHPTQKTLIELHFKLDYFGIDFFPIKSLTPKPVMLLNIPTPTLPDDHHLLYLMIHGSIHAWSRLRWLQDIALFIKENRCDLNHVFVLAKKIHCDHIVIQTLLLTNQLFPMQHDELQALIQNPSRRSSQLAELGMRFITADYEFTDGIKNIPLFFTYRFYLIKLAVRGKKFSALRDDFFKIDELFSKITFPEKLSFMYYLCYPLWILGYIRRMMNKST